ncbi:uncharacterized protein LOC122859109 isoform X2 [Aphidius gifuensis]|nr:uncharacterized protein LOC122859109 isoform X2 [Aphidius gifuensis]
MASDKATPCKEDSECQSDQYCYNISKICVSYTMCSRYNRYENDTQSQKPTQCGPCLPGFVAELYIDGKESSLCIDKIQLKLKKEQIPIKTTPGDDEFFKDIWLCGGIIFFIFLIVPTVVYATKHIHGRVRNEKWFPMRPWNLSPSAPPPDTGAYHLQRPYYSEEDPPIYSAVVDNNNTSKDKNILVNAVPSKAPDWVIIDPSYDDGDPDVSTSTNISTMSNTTLNIEDEETTPSSWTPEPVTVAVSTRAFHQFAPEQRDNVVNAVLVRGDCSSPRNSSNHSDDGPAPEATSSSRTTGDSYRGPNVQINQMITLNMVKSDFN